MVTRISSTIHIVDPKTLQTAELQARTYWEHEFAPLHTREALTRYIVLDSEIVRT